MARLQSITLPASHAAALVDTKDLRFVISKALAASPVDEGALRHGVWMFVGTERDAGASPGQVIIALTNLVGAASIASASGHQARLRRVMLWCIEAYFGHLDGDVVGRDSDAFADLPRPIVESMSNKGTGESRFIRGPHSTPAEIANEPAPFPATSDTMPRETSFPDWRARLTRNLSRHSQGRWEPLTYVHVKSAWSGS